MENVEGRRQKPEGDSGEIQNGECRMQNAEFNHGWACFEKTDRESRSFG
jgi:hypothetical protein